MPALGRWRVGGPVRLQLFPQPSQVYFFACMLLYPLQMLDRYVDAIRSGVLEHHSCFVIEAADSHQSPRGSILRWLDEYRLPQGLDDPDRAPFAGHSLAVERGARILIDRFLGHQPKRN